MGFFDASSPDVYALKSDLLGVPGGANPNKYWAAVDTTKLRVALVDTHTQVRGGKFYGFADQGADPNPGLGAGKSYLYAVTAALKWKDSAALLRILHDDQSNLTMASGKTLTVGGNVLIGAVANKLNGTQLAFASQAIGDLAYADSTTTFTRLAAVATGKYLRAGGAGSAPLWSTLVLPNAAALGEMPVANPADTLVMSILAAIYGDGSDGDVTISTNTNLTRDMYYNNLTINTSSVLNPSGFRVFVKNLLTIDAGSAIRRTGGAASGATGGASGSGSITTVLGAAGATGGTGAGAAGGGGRIGGVGAAGGAGAGGANAGGAGGTNAGLQFGQSVRALPWALLGQEIQGQTTPQGIPAGTGGGAGGGDGANAGGGGGAGAGPVIVAARNVILNGTIEAKGGPGANGVAGNAGGGGGGGGGFSVLVHRTKSGSGSVLAPGGIKGNGVGTGANGNDGNAGITVELTA